jgi:hypothetical protein
MLEADSKKLLLQYGGVIVLIVVIAVAVRTCTLHTASFARADLFIKMNPIVAAKLGPIDSTSLKYGKFVNGGGESRAHYEITAIGHLARGLVRVDLLKSDSEWKVISASLVLPHGDIIVLK